MATYYVGTSSAGSANGSSWANRLGSLNAAEDLPVAAGDTVYVGPGTYRESLTIDVSGSGGSPITYIADITGANTDGVGGKIRVTGSDDDTSGTRSTCVNAATTRDYRTFRGFTMDGNTGASMNVSTSSSNWIIEDCWFNTQFGASASQCIAFESGTTNTVRRCVFVASKGQAIIFTSASNVDNAGHVVENCLVIGAGTYGIQIDKVGGGTARNCLFLGCQAAGVRVLTALTGGQTWNVNNSIFVSNTTGVRSTTSGELTENYNTFFGNGTDRNTSSTGANSVSHGVLFEPFMLLNNGRCEPWLPFALMAASSLRNRAGTSPASTDVFGTARAQETDSDWGGVEALAPISKEGSTVRTGASSYKINGRGYYDLRIPVVASTAVTVSCYVKWDNNASIGSKPQLKLLADYGVSEQTATATGDGTSSWELLSVSGTPNADGVMIARILNRSTHTSAIATYVDDITRV